MVKFSGTNRTDHVSDDFGEGSSSIEIPLLKAVVLKDIKYSQVTVNVSFLFLMLVKMKICIFNENV